TSNKSLSLEKDKEIESLKTSVEDNEKKLADFKNQLSESKIQASRLKDELEKVSKELNLSKDEYTKIVKNSNKLKEEIKERRDEETKLKQQHAKELVGLNDISILKEKLSAAENEKVLIKTSYESLKQDYESSKIAKSDYANQIVTLSQKLKELENVNKEQEKE